MFNIDTDLSIRPISAGISSLPANWPDKPSSTTDGTRGQHRNRGKAVLRTSEQPSPREDVISAWISRFHRREGRLPSITKIVKKFRCGRGTASAARVGFERALHQPEKWGTFSAYINDLLISPSHANRSSYINRISFKSNLNALKRIQRSIENGVYSLFNEHPDTLLHLRFTVPSDSEECFLAAAHHAEDLAHSTISRLFPKRDRGQALWVFRWELCHEQKKRLHFHALFHWPYREKLYRSKLKQVWFSELKKLDAVTGSEPFTCENGHSARVEADGWVFIKPYPEQPNQHEFPWTYFSTAKKHSHWNVAGRRLDLLDGNLVSPKVHGGLSPALRALVEKTSCVIEIPIYDDCFDHIVDDFKSRTAVSSEWYRHYSTEWNITRIPREDYAAVLSRARAFKSEIDEWLPPEHLPRVLSKAPGSIKFTLSPDRRIRIHTHQKKNNPQTHQGDKS